MRAALTRGAVLAAALLFAATMALPAHAGCRGAKDEAQCEGGTTAQIPPLPGAPADPVGGVVEWPDHTYWLPVLSFSQEEDCWYVDVAFFPELGAPEAGSIHRSYDSAVAYINENWPELPPCPDQDEPTPAEIAQHIWEEEAVVPRPRPRVEPGNQALTGLSAFLEIDGAASWSYSGDNVELRASPEYTVDWGDGSPPLTTTSRGGPYPDGDLTHLYRYARVFTLTVTATWTGEWRLAGSGGRWQPVDGTLVSEGSTDLAVSQVQAMRRR